MKYLFAIKEVRPQKLLKKNPSTGNYKVSRPKEKRKREGKVVVSVNPEQVREKMDYVSRAEGCLPWKLTLRKYLRSSGPLVGRICSQRPRRPPHSSLEQ